MMTPLPSSPSELFEIANQLPKNQILEAILSDSENAMISEDLQGIITSWNKGAENVFGYTAEEVIGKSIEMLFPLDRQDEGMEIHKQILKGKQLTHFVTKRICKGGRSIDVSIAITPIFDAKSKVTGASNIARDITAHLMLNYKLQFAEAIIEKANDAIIGKDLNGTILSWNQGAERIFGYSATEVLGKSIQILMPADRLDEEKQILKLIGQGETLEHFETVRKCKDGTLINISITISAIRDALGKIVGASQIARDITLQRNLQRELLVQDRTNRALAIQKEEHEKQAAELAIFNEKLKVSLFQTVGLARELGEMRDPYTSGHEQGVGDLSAAIANELGLEQEFQDGIRVAGYLHDIGKAMVPIEILVKPAALTPNEYELVKEHVEAGYQVLKKITFPWDIARAELEHHERLDGSGYPRGLKDGDISIGGRILAVADVFDSMTNHRPYRPALGADSALAELQRGSSVLYDKAVVDACVSLIKVKGYQVKGSGI